MNIVEGHLAIEPPQGVPVWDVDPYDDAILANPLPYYAELRAKGPFVYIPKYSILACGRHAETQEVFADHERFVSSRGVGLLDFTLADPWRPPSIVLEVDPPYHTQNRRVLMRALSPKAVAGLRDDFQKTASALVKSLLKQGSFDGVTELAEVFPTTVFPAAVGLKNVDKRKLVDYGSSVFSGLGPDNAQRQAALKTLPGIAPWIMEQCKRENLNDNGFAATIYEAADEGEITHEEASLLVRSLLSAGIDTTVTGIGNMLWCLAEFPEALQVLKGDPSLIRPAFEEVQRYISPVHSFARTAGHDLEISGVKILEGTKILCVLGSANADPAKWPNADKFEVTRKPMGHLAMGTGIHSCVGQNVARAEAFAVLTAIVEQVEKVEFTGTPVWRPNNAIHALDQLPLRFS